MYDIENRVGRDLLMYTMINNNYYESIENHTAKEKNFFHVLNKLLPEDWKVHYQRGIWCQVTPPQSETPNQGFKIHLSATYVNAERILEKVLPIVVKHQTVFKFIVDEFTLNIINSQNYPKSSSGKFITIYPPDTEKFSRLVKDLDQVTEGDRGPYILSDRVFGNSKVVFYRYGGFKPNNKLKVNGFKTPVILGTNGDWIPDDRSPFFSLPTGVEDPFSTPQDTPEIIKLADRYQAQSVLASSNKGGIYLFLDEVTQATVVIKEARPLVNATGKFPHDAIDMLRNEYEILKLLEPSGVAPKPLAFFKEWDHYYLVMERVEGIPLSSFRAMETFSLMLKTDYSDREILEFCEVLLILAENIHTGLQKIHEKDLILLDLAPQNLLVDPSGLTIKFIDFENAYRMNDADRIHAPIGTMGFVSENRRNQGQPKVEDDYYAYRNIMENLIFPVQLFFHLNPKSREYFLKNLFLEKRLPPELLHFLDQLSLGPEPTTAAIQEFKQTLRQIKIPAQVRPERRFSRFAKLRDQVAEDILHSVQYNHPARLFPGDYRVFGTNPLSLAYGAMGIYWFLKRSGIRVPDRLDNELLARCRDLSNDHYAPGFFIGSSGVAWVMAQTGRAELAADLMAKVYASPLLAENADLFHGAAGWGLASLYVHKQTGQQIFLDKALEAAKIIEASLQEEEDCLSYQNMTGDVYHGLAYGSAGIALFFLNLYQRTQAAAHLGTALKLIRFEIRHQVAHPTHVTWPRSRRNTKVHSPYMGTGNAGIGIVLLKAYQQVGQAEYLDLARKSARYLAGKYSLAPGYLTGMAGMGSFLIEMYRVTGEHQWLEEAQRFGERVLLYRIDTEAGLAFPGEDLVRICHDLATGSAGVGAFFHQLVHPEEGLYDF